MENQAMSTSSPETGSNSYQFDPKKDNDIFNISKAKNMQIKYRKFFERKDLDNFGCLLWLKSLYEYAKELTGYDFINLQKDRNLAATLTATSIGAIIFSPKLAIEERMMLCSFVDKELDSEDLKTKADIHKFSLYKYNNSTFLAVLLECPHITFADRMDYAEQLLDKYPTIIFRFFMETPITLEEACSFLDNYEDLVAAIIKKDIDKYQENGQLQINKLIDLKSFIAMNSSLNAFEKIHLLNKYIHKFADFPNDAFKEEKIKTLAQDMFFQGSMSLQEILRYQFWVPFLGAYNYNNLLMQAANRRGTPVSRHRKTVFEFRQTTGKWLLDPDDPRMIKVMEDYWSGRINYLAL